MLEREEAKELVENMVKNKNLIKHMLAAEAVMKSLADKFNEDAGEWGLAGLLHDIDYDETFDKPEIHALRSAEILSEKNICEEVIHSIKAHAGKAAKETLMDKALYAVDPLTGFLVACTLMTPKKKLSNLDREFALRRFKEKGFARGANREQMKCCQEIGLSLEEFIDIGIESMQSISDTLSL
ncbi:MAG: HDIG domain-containing protein [Actinomycetia bacterium]|nr:HDIG domain-containing protein [Actinomycetes bacterium]